MKIRVVNRLQMHYAYGTARPSAFAFDAHNSGESTAAAYVSRKVDALARPTKTRYPSKGRGFLRFWESAMRPYAKSLVKRQERRLMQSLMERRERKTPEHHSPEWVAAYWRQVTR